MGKTKIILFFILVFGLVLRLINLNQGLWLDEAIGAISVKQFSGLEIINQLSTRDNHPPLYYLVLDIFTTLFGYSDVSIRMPGVIFGVIAVYLTFILSKTVELKRPFITTILMAISPFMVYYSQEARMYMLTVVSALFTSIYLVKVVKHDRTRDWLVFALSLVILFLADYILLFLLPGILVVLLATNRSYKGVAKIVLSFFPTFIIAAAWSPIFLIQVGGYSWLARNFNQWFQIVGGFSFKELFLFWSKMLLGRVSINPDLLYALFVGAFSFPVFVFILRAVHRLTKIQWVVFVLFFSPPLISFVTSLITPTFNYFRFTYSFPFLAVIVGAALQQRGFFRSKLLLIWVMGMAIGLTLTYFDKNQGREAWNKAAQMINANKNIANENSVVLQEFPEPFAPWRWYNTDTPSYGATDGLSATEATYTKVRELVHSFDKVYYFEYLSEVTNPNDYTKKALVDSGFVEKEAFSNFNGIGIIRVWQR